MRFTDICGSFDSISSSMIRCPEGSGKKDANPWRARWMRQQIKKKKVQGIAPVRLLAVSGAMLVSYFRGVFGFLSFAIYHTSRHKWLIW